MSNLLSEIKTTFRNEKQTWRARRAFFKENETDITELVGELNLGKASSGRMDCETDEINLYVTGDTSVLKEIFRGFRKLGYEPSKRPGIKPESTFTTYFSQDGKPTFYLSFSSTVCRRVKVGTKTVEQDIYEVVCE